MSTYIFFFIPWNSYRKNAITITAENGVNKIDQTQVDFVTKQS